MIANDTFDFVRNSELPCPKYRIVKNRTPMAFSLDYHKNYNNKKYDIWGPTNGDATL